MSHIQACQLDQGVPECRGVPQPRGMQAHCSRTRRRGRDYRSQSDLV